MSSPSMAFNSRHHRDCTLLPRLPLFAHGRRRMLRTLMDRPDASQEPGEWVPASDKYGLATHP